MTQKLLTVKDVAAILNVSKSSVYGYVAQKQLNPIYMPLTSISKATMRNKRSIRFTPDSIKEFFEKLTICC